MSAGAAPPQGARTDLIRLLPGRRQEILRLVLASGPYADRRAGRFYPAPSPLHDLMPLHELAVALPEGACLFDGKGYFSLPNALAILKACRVHVIARTRANMNPLAWADGFDFGLYPHTIETVNIQFEILGVQHRYVRKNPRLMLKELASMIVFKCTDMNQQPKQYYFFSP